MLIYTTHSEINKLKFYRSTSDTRFFFRWNFSSTSSLLTCRFRKNEAPFQAPAPATTINKDVLIETSRFLRGVTEATDIDYDTRYRVSTSDCQTKSDNFSHSARQTPRLRGRVWLSYCNCITSAFAFCALRRNRFSTPSAPHRLPAGRIIRN